ncbi:MAG: hypothetical protein RLZZ127_871, partial [Planctomycetota bacterium]
MRIRSRIAAAALAALALLTPLVAADPPVQPRVLPMADLLKRLDPATPWQFLPLADWQRLRALAAATPATAAWSPDGAWTGGLAHLHVQDGWVHGRAELTAVALADRLPIQVALLDGPAFLAIDDRPALVEAAAPGSAGFVSVVGVTPGPHRITWTWATPISDPQAVAVPLPAGATVVRITAKAPLQISGERIVADGAGWRWLPDGGLVTFRIRAGDAADRQAVWGVQQDLDLTWQDGEGLGTWKVMPVGVSGPVPEDLTVRLPDGWTVLPTAQMPMTSVAPGVVRLRPGLWRVLVDARGTLAAPRVSGAVHP